MLIIGQQGNADLVILLVTFQCNNVSDEHNAELWKSLTENYPGFIKHNLPLRDIASVFTRIGQT
jgi:hypothetical protein